MKIRNLLTMFLVAATLVGCGTGANSSNDSSTGNSTSSLTNPVTENVVKIKKIDVNENQSQVQNIKARNIKKANDDSTEELNYTIITRPQSEVQFTITLDNPKAYGINALEISCDDENAEIMIEGEYKKISDYSIVLWSSENAYEKTYNIKTDSLDELTTFKVTDIRLEGETKFQSELTNSTDLGNNELQIYKMDTDAYTLNVIENTFEYIKFNFNVKDKYKDIISNIRIKGLESDEHGVYFLTKKQKVEIEYDYCFSEYDMKVSRMDHKVLGPMELILSTQNNGHAVMVYSDSFIYDSYFYDNILTEKLPVDAKYPNVFFNMKIIDGLGNVVIPEIYTTNGYSFEYIHKSSYDFNEKNHHAYFYYSDFFTENNVNEMTDIASLFRFKIGNNVYIFEGTWWKFALGNEIDNIVLEECDYIIDGIKYKDNGSNLMVVGYTSSISNEVDILSTISDKSVVSIENNAFLNCSSLTSITIPNSVTSIGDNAFSGCGSLESIAIPNSVTSIGNNVFSGCSSLTSITIPNSVTSIGDNAFSGCNSLGSIIIPNSVTNIGTGAFLNCSPLVIYCEAESELSGWVSSWNNNNPVYYGITLEDVIEQNGIQYLLVAGEAIVTGYVGNKTELIIPASVEQNGITYNVTSIGDKAFYRHSSLTSIVISNGVTSIGTGAFFDCSSLTSITIPNSVTSFGYRAFTGCNSLTNVYYEGTIEEWCSNTFDIDSNPMSYAEHFYILDENNEWREVILNNI